MTDERVGAVLFDVDGTLVDSNYLHVYAWLRAFTDEGLCVPTWRIHRGIGMDGSALVRELSGNAPDEVQQRLSRLHSRYYRDVAHLMRVLPGARELLHQVNDLGLEVVLATSAPEDELAYARRVLDCDDVVCAVTTAGDVDVAKPEPGIVQVALERAGVSAGRAVFVGDAVWDAQACSRAGVPFIGVLTGGVGRDELLGAGATDVAEDAHALSIDLRSSAIAVLLD